MSLYFDTDNQGFDGFSIASGIPEADGSGSYVWDASSVPNGQYYVYAMVDDGVNVPQFAYAAEPVVITSPGIEGRIWNDANGNGMWNSGELPMPGVAVYLDQNGDGILNEGEVSTMSRADDPDTPGDEAGSYQFTQLAFGSYLPVRRGSTTQFRAVISRGWQ